MLQHAVTTGGESVRLSVCSAHGGNMSKLMTIFILLPTVQMNQSDYSAMLFSSQTTEISD